MKQDEFFEHCWEYILINGIYLFLSFFVLRIFVGVGLTIFLMIIIYMSLIKIMFDDKYEKFLCFLQGARPLKTRKEKAYLEPIFKEVIKKNKGIKLYIINDFSINAFAIGNTIAITKGAINGLSKEQLKGIIAHELGHIYLGHTTGAKLGLFGNGIFSIITIIVKLLKIPIDNRIAEPKGERNLVFSVLSGIGRLIIFIADMLKLIIGSARNRYREFNADSFANRFGYGKELLSALYVLDDIMPEGFIDIKQHVTRTHPYLYDRIAWLEGLMEYKPYF